MSRIFIVEDDEVLCQELVRVLEVQGYEAHACQDFAAAPEEALAWDPDLMIVDLSLPGADGHAICRGVRKESAVPLIILTSSTSEFDEIMSLRLGADDYLTKPYSPMVLLAHIERALSRSGAKDPQGLSYAGLELDAPRSRVSYQGSSADLSRNEMQILASLVRAQGAVVSRQDLMFDLWQSDQFVDDNTLTVNVNRLRRALSDLGVPRDFLKTHRGRGYSL